MSKLDGIEAVNNFSIGIEICNWGKLTKKDDKFYISHGEPYHGPAPIHAAERTGNPTPTRNTNRLPS